jgi:integrase
MNSPRSFPVLDQYIAFRKNSVSANYLRDSHSVLRAYERARNAVWGREESTDTIQAWLNALPIKPATIAAYAFTLKQYFDWQIRQGMRVGNPVVGICVPKHRKPFRKVFVSGAVVNMLISECEDQELKYCLYCGFHAGLRFNEVVMSRPEWFSLPETLLHVTRSEDWDTKDHDDRTIPLTRDFLAFLRVYGLKVPFMIAPHKRTGGRHRYRFDFSRRFENYMRSKNVQITFHDTRRTFASLHATAGTSIFKIAHWLGDDVTVVQRHYAHLAPADPEINRAFLA